MSRCCLIAFLFWASFVFAQKEAFNWQFGNKADISFHSKPPAPKHKSQMYSNEGCASISSSDGQLLFYSNGESVWDSTHNIMPNGNGLYGSNTTAQACIALPYPNKNNQYVLFTLDQIYGTHGLNYSVIDMSLNSGKGNVINTQKNIPLIPQAQVTEKLSAVLHANGRDYWIICPQAGSDSFYAFLLDPSGVHSKAVMSNTHFNLAWKTTTDKIGCLKSSPNGQYFAFANINMDTLVFGQFNNQTGKITNAWSLYVPQCYGVEFSPNSQVLYVTQPTIFRIQQYVCNSSNKAAFISSLKYIANVQYPYGIQLGPDEKIYVNCLSRDDISVIHAPDSIGTACRFQYRAIQLSSYFKDSRLGLPQYLPQYLFGNDIQIQNQCANDTTHFSFQNNNRDSAFWDFGDSGSINNQISGTQNIYHLYKKPGRYTIKINYYKQGLAYNKYLSINIYQTVGIKVNKDTNICLHQTAQLFVVNGKQLKQIQWPSGSHQDTLYTNTQGRYIVQGIDQNNCPSYDTVKVTVASVRASIQYHDTAYCLSDNQFKVKAQSIIQNDSLLTTHWEFGDQTTSNDSVYTKQYQTAGRFEIKLIVTSKNKCQDSFSRYVQIWPQPKAQILGRDSSLCYHQNPIQLLGLNKSIRYQWQYGDGQSDTQSQMNHVYAKPGKYLIQLTQFDTSLCQSTDSIQLQLLEARPKIQLSDSSVCYLQQNIQAQVQSGFKTHTWDWGDGYTNSGQPQKHFYSSPGDFIVTCIVTDSLGCSGKDSVLLKIHYLNKRVISQTDSLCEKQQPYQFKFNNTLKKVLITWSDASIDSGQIIQKTFKQTGLHTGYCLSTDSFGCMYTDTLKTVTLLSAKASFDYQIKSCEGKLYLNSTSFGTTQTHWLIDSLESHQAQGEYPLPKFARFKVTLIATDALNKCADTVTQILQQDSASQEALIIPNVFTPNQDGYNNCYTLGGLHPECGDKATIQIFDRWGIKVFEGDLATTCWNGKNQADEPLSNGVYYYIIYAKTASMNQTIEGLIHLIR